MDRRADLLNGVRARAGVLAAAGVAAAVLVTSALTSSAPERLRLVLGWNILGVRVAMIPAFADLRNVTSRWACARAGVDNYRDGRCDPWGRLFNYPPPWLAPAGWGWDQRLTLPLGLLEVAVFLAALCALFRASSGREAAATALLLLTPPVMFAVERGNVDMLMFSAVVAAFVGARGLPERGRAAVRFAVLAGLGMLKLYPLAGLAYAARTPRRAALTAAAAVLAGAAIWAAYRPILPLMASNSGDAVDDSYGRLIAFALHAPGGVLTPELRRESLVAAAGVLGLGAAGGVLLARRMAEGVGSLLGRELSAQLAAAGVAVYLSTWLIGSSYDYRLIFLLLVFPHLFAVDGGRWRGPALALGLLIAGRLALAHRVPFAWAAGYDYVLVPVLTAWAAASAWRAWVVRPADA